MSQENLEYNSIFLHTIASGLGEEEGKSLRSGNLRLINIIQTNVKNLLPVTWQLTMQRKKKKRKRKVSLLRYSWPTTLGDKTNMKQIAIRKQLWFKCIVWVISTIRIFKKRSVRDGSHLGQEDRIWAVPPGLRAISRGKGRKNGIHSRRSVPWGQGFLCLVH